MHIRFLWYFAFLALPVAAAERAFDFTNVPENQQPPGFRSSVTGKGKPGDWRIVLDEVPPMLTPLTPQAPTVSRRPVLAQQAQDPTDEHFPILTFEGESYGDFTFSTRFKTVRGAIEQMAGVVFRLQNETNYYVLRASSLGNTFRFYKVVNGVRGTLIGPELPITSGVWHSLAVTCKGNEIRCRLDDQQIIPTITDNSFASGKVGFWTKSDSVSYFTEARIEYTPREIPAQVIVKRMIKNYPRLLGFKVFVLGSDPKTTRLIASNDEKELGQAGGKAEFDVISLGATYYGKSKDSVAVTMPLRDRNGDIISAVRVVMKSFPGQTEENAVVRAAPLVKELQAGIQSLQDLVP